MEKSVAIITARGGSKRIPKKNIKKFCGKPIIAYSIESALKSGVFDKIMVSTDSHEIAETARKYGAEVPFMRSRKASDDYATTSDVLLEVIEEFEKKEEYFSYACCIYPTAPFVTAEKLKAAMQELENKKADTVIPVMPFSYPPQRGIIIKEGFAELKWEQYRDSRSQDLETLYHDCGQYYAFLVESLKKNKNLLSGKIVSLVQSPLEAQDIDSLDDWQLAELKYKLMKENKSCR